LDRAVGFYENTLGFTLKYRFGDYAGLVCGGVEIGLKTWGEMDAPRKGEPCVDLAVNGIDELYNELSSKGVNFVRGPEDVPWGARIAVLKDPDGNTLQLNEIDWAKYLKAASSG
jgi:uncharacterized glyoxalase superfamily protein PhnB